MQTSTSKGEQVVQAVFSVCVPSDLIGGITDAVGAVPGSEFIGQFQEYITADKRPQFPDWMKDALGCVALIGCDVDPKLAIDTMDRLAYAFPNKLSLIAVSSNTDADLLVRAMRSGCSEFLMHPIDGELLQAALRRFQKGHESQPQVSRGSGKVISIYGVKGGVGTTTMSVHLAVNLAWKHRKKVLLIDHKHELGHVALHLGMKESVYHFDELIRNVDRLDSDLLDGFVNRHISGLDVIPSPDSCSSIHEASAESISRVMEELRSRYDFILVDSSLQSSPQVGPIMDASDEIVLVCTPDVAALRDLVRRIEHLNVITGFTSKLRVVINRSTADDAVSIADIEAALRFPISVAVPNNYSDLMRAINAGEPVPPQHRGAFSQAIAKWANGLVTHQSANETVVAPVPRKKFFFGFQT